jgi:hypothetical protein
MAQLRSFRGIGIVTALASAAALASFALATPAGANSNRTPYLSHFHTVTTMGSTVPPNGDVNPYGVAIVRQSVGSLVRGNTLVSNFNASSNLQGTGKTIVQVSPSGQLSVFSHIHPSQLPGACPGGVGLTTALAVLSSGDVVVGSLPVTKKGMGTPKAGCLIVLDSSGTPIETWSGNGINGPWDMTAVQTGNFAQLFVTNVLNGTVAAGGGEVDQGTVIRLDVLDRSGMAPSLLSATTVATGFPEELNSSALVLGPTGDALSPNGTLYVADTVASRIAAVPNATSRQDAVTGGGTTVTSGGSLNAPLGMALAPNGDVLTVNGNDPNAVETTPSGQQIDTVQLDPLGSGGDLFGLALPSNSRGVIFVDDGDNTLKFFGP